MAGKFTQVSSGTPLRIFPPAAEILAWSALAEVFIASRSIPHKQLEKLASRFPLNQTSVFGRFDRTLLRPLHRKLRQRSFQGHFYPDELSLLAWRAASIRADRLRVPHLKSIRPEVVLYTEAATSTALIAAVSIDVGNFAKEPAFDATLTEPADMSRLEIFSEINLIYGLEMLAVLATMCTLRDFTAGRNVIFTSTILMPRTPFRRAIPTHRPLISLSESSGPLSNPQGHGFGSDAYRETITLRTFLRGTRYYRPPPGISPLLGASKSLVIW